MKPVTKDQILYDSIYIKILKRVQKVKISGWLGLGGMLGIGE